MQTTPDNKLVLTRFVLPMTVLESPARQMLIEELMENSGYSAAVLENTLTVIGRVSAEDQPWITKLIWEVAYVCSD